FRRVLFRSKLNPKDVIIIDPKAGYLRPQKSILSAVNRAKNFGARIFDYSSVENINQKQSKIDLEVKNRTYSVNKLLITAGPWSKKFMPSLENYLKVQRLLNAWFLPKADLFSSKDFPIFSRSYSKGSYYGIPAVDNEMVKLGIHGNKATLKSPENLNKNISVDRKSTRLNSSHVSIS